MTMNYEDRPPEMADVPEAEYNEAVRVSAERIGMALQAWRMLDTSGEATYPSQDWVEGFVAAISIRIQMMEAGQ